MKLVSCANSNPEWGIVIDDAVSGSSYVLNPTSAQKFLDGYCRDRTVGFFLNRPKFFPECIPQTMVALLELGEVGLEAARKLKVFAELFIVQSDRTLLSAAACPLDEIELLAPIPEPRLLWGLVGNVPSFARPRWDAKQIQLVPVGHQRPLGTVFGHRQTRPIFEGSSGNAELGVVIGTRGRNIPMSDAMAHVAGYTVVNDMAHNLYAGKIKEWKEQAGQSNLSTEEMAKAASERGMMFDEYYSAISASWAGKGSDRMCAIGPWIATPDEVGDPYNLLAFTHRNGEQLGRGHTNGLLIGIERAIAYYSSFATLHPGDIIHFGAVAKDGYTFAAGPGQSALMRSEFENIGGLEVDVHLHSGKEEAKMPPAQRDSAWKEPITSPNVLNEIALRNFYIVYGNCTQPEIAASLEPTVYPRFLCAPGSCVGTTAEPTEIFTPKIKVSAELCAIIGKTCRGLMPEEVADAVAGITPLLCVENEALKIPLERALIAFEREQVLPEIYGRWGDHFNIVADTFIDRATAFDATIHLQAGERSATYHAKDYFLKFPEVISFVSSYITLYPGDVVTLGKLGPAINLAPLSQETVTVSMRGAIIQKNLTTHP